MSSLIPEEKISEVKHAADIVDVISDVVLLKKTGQNFIGLCPFHSEKTPSFTVSPGKQIFHCFGCGEGGNVFSFLMKHQGLSFPEAVRAVAGRYGIDLPKYTDKRQKKAASERQRLLNVNRQAFNFYRRQFDSERGRTVRAYLKKRGISQSTIEKFGIGYAPPGWDNLLQHLKSRGVSPALSQLAGLTVSRKNGAGSYDRFRNRVMIPIFNLGGEVIAFGGRALGDDGPKYLNSPETPLFNKRRTLFNLQRARAKCRQTGEVIIVEGYFDLIALDQAGIENVVATLGTALTPEHVRGHLKGCAPRMVLVYDGDEAGRKAAESSYAIFGSETSLKVELSGYRSGTQNSFDTCVVALPSDHDPDSFVARYGAETFLKMVGEAPGILTFLLELSLARHGLSIQGKMRVIEDMVPILAEIGDQVGRSLYIRELADRLEVSERDILQKVRAAVSARGNRQKGGARSRRTDANARRQGKGLPRSEGTAGSFRIERQIVAMMVQYPSIIPEVARRRVTEHFQYGDLRKAADFLLKNSSLIGNDPGGAVGRIDDEKLRRLLTSMAVDEESWNEKTCHLLLDQFEYGLRRRRDDLQKQIESAEKNGDQELLLKLLRERQVRAQMKSVPF